jgi:hypothetical protein
MKKANHDMWNARMGTLEKSASEMRVALWRIVKSLSLLKLNEQPSGGAASCCKIHEHDAVFDGCGEDSEARRLGGAHWHPAQQIEVASVQRADNCGPCHDSVA